jgi:hypothetical protein
MSRTVVHSGAPAQLTAVADRRAMLLLDAGRAVARASRAG